MPKCLDAGVENNLRVVASRVLTRKNAAYIIGMNLLTKFFEDRTLNVASRVKKAPPLGSHVFQANVTIFELVQDMIETIQVLNRANFDVALRTTETGRRTKGDHNSSP
ncbi:hypothetical protein DPMN_041182 [Dreissena polymorpha]|uniref:Uncharacterized protein n=1 Tax=Dreissena polymorpha TaxID=45954 RepID=A0A9D4HVS2_DREPO|nr:hypothetical protein DPMN_041182 [Dreissena polymorpha]